MKTELNYNTVYRTYKGHSIPEVGSILSLSSEICDTVDERVDLLSSVAPDVINMAEDLSLKYKPQKCLTDVLSDEFYFLVICLTSKENGTTRQEVEHCTSFMGLDALEHLIRMKSVKIKNDRFYLVKENGKIFSHDRNLTKKHIKTLLKRISHKRSKKETLYAVMEGLSEDGYLECQQILQEAKNKIKKVAEHKRGDINFFCGMFSNIIGSNNEIK